MFMVHIACGSRCMLQVLRISPGNPGAEFGLLRSQQTMCDEPHGYARAHAHTHDANVCVCVRA